MNKKVISLIVIGIFIIVSFSVLINNSPIQHNITKGNINPDTTYSSLSFNTISTTALDGAVHLSYNPTYNSLYSTSQNNYEVQIYNLNSNSVTTVSTTGEAWGSAYNSYNGYTYVTADYEGTGVTVLNGTSIVTTISLTNFGTGLSLEQSIWYDQYYNAIIVQLDAAHYAIINGSTNSVSYMAVGNGNNADGNGNDGFGGTYSPITHLVYTVDSVNNSVSNNGRIYVNSWK